MGQEVYFHDISCMLPTLLQKAVFTKEVSHKYQHQNILATAWRLEELKHHIDLMERFSGGEQVTLWYLSQRAQFIQVFLVEG